MGTLIRAHDWAATSIGPLEKWPQSLRTAVRILLNTGHPMYIFWGPDLLCLYNDAYRASIGPERHPGSIGQPARHVWAEIWEIIGPQIDQVMRGGGATWNENHLVPITRNGRREEVYWTYSYGPIDDDSVVGGVGGVLVVCTETTAAVLAERRRADEAARQRRLFEQAPGFIIIMRGQEHVVEFVNDAHRRLFGSADWVGKDIRQAFPDLEGQGFFELLDGVYATGETYRAFGAAARFYTASSRNVETRFLDFVYAPLVDDGGAVAGVFCEGFDVTERRVAERALERSEEQRRLATEAAEVGFWDVDVVAETLFWPPRVKAMFGISPAAAVSMPDFYAGLHPDDREHVVAAYAAAADPAKRLVYDVESRTIGKEDGVVRWVGAKGRGVFDEQDRCVRVIGIAIDITARKETEIALRRLNETLEQRVTERTAERNLLAKLFEATDVFIMVVDLGWRILAINKANEDEFERIHGVRPKSGDHLLELLADQPEHQAQVKAGWGRALAGEDYTFVEDFGDPKRDRPYYEIKFNTLRNERGERIGAYNFVYDVTQRLRDQAKLAQA